MWKKRFNNRGDLDIPQEVGSIAIILVILAVLAVGAVYLILSGKGGQILDSIFNALHFGRF